MDNNTLDYLARFFGRLYDCSLRAARLCDVSDCSLKRNGVCTCTDPLRDVVDMIWEAKGGRPERFDRIVEEARAVSEAKHERLGA